MAGVRVTGSASVARRFIYGLFLPVLADASEWIILICGWKGGSVAALWLPRLTL